MKTLEDMEGEFCEASNALRAEHKRLGFFPGVKVIAQCMDDPPKNGVIAEYGPLWATVDALMVPVRLDTGGIQPWMVSSLTLLKEAKDAP